VSQCEIFVFSQDKIGDLL